MASFYDLDYIIDINEKRLEQYSGAYQKNVDRFTNIMVIYSGFVIFLIPIMQSLFFSETKCHFIHYLSFYAFIILFSYSLINTIRLLIPEKVAYLKEPEMYYNECRLMYESLNIKRNAALRLHEIDNLIKSSYIDELEQALSINNALLNRKGIFYHKAFMWAIYAIVPYLICIGFQLAIKDEKIKTVKIVGNLRNFNKSEYMDNTSEKLILGSTPTRRTGSNLPGVDNSLVIPSEPIILMEDFTVPKRKKQKSKRWNILKFFGWD